MNKKLRKRLSCPTCQDRLMMHVVLIDGNTGKEYWRKCWGCHEYTTTKEAIHELS